MRKLIAATVLAACSVTPAFARDASQNFNGPHVEIITGYDNVRGGGDGSSGLMYGIGAGYDFRLDNVVLGIEGEVADSTTGECNGGACADAARDLYIGGRIGAVVGDNVLVYGKVGYSNARVEATAANVTTGTNLDGLRVGAGVEWQIDNSPISLRAEYRYTNYEAGVERHQGVLGLSYRF